MTAPVTYIAFTGSDTVAPSSRKGATVAFLAKSRWQPIPKAGDFLIWKTDVYYVQSVSPMGENAILVGMDTGKTVRFAGKKAIMPSGIPMPEDTTWWDCGERVADYQKLAKERRAQPLNV